MNRMADNIIDIDKILPHRLAETICVKCYQRIISVWPDGVKLKDLECENCGNGYIILTGETIDEE